MLKVPTGGRQTSWLLTKRGLGFENGATVKQSGTWTQGLRITRPAPLPLGHGASPPRWRVAFLKGDIQGLLGLQMLQHAVYFRSLFSKTTHPDWSESYTIFQVSKSFLHVINAWSPPTHVCSSLTLVRSKLKQEGRGLLGIIAYVYDVAVNGLPQGAGLCKMSTFWCDNKNWQIFDPLHGVSKSDETLVLVFDKLLLVWLNRETFASAVMFHSLATVSQNLQLARKLMHPGHAHSHENSPVQMARQAVCKLTQLTAFPFFSVFCLCFYTRKVTQSIQIWTMIKHDHQSRGKRKCYIRPAGNAKNHHQSRGKMKNESNQGRWNSVWSQVNFLLDKRFQKKTNKQKPRLEPEVFGELHESCITDF